MTDRDAEAGGGVPRRRFGFALAVASVTAMMAGASAPSPFYPVLAESIGFSPLVTTSVFAVYALALLATLLTAGSLSDHVGRRPVASSGLVLLAASVFVFWHAGSVPVLILARVLQGVASGLLLSAVSAAITDLESPRRPGSAAVWNAVAPMLGLGIGALAAGLALDGSHDAMAVVFAPLVVVYLVLAALTRFVPETAPRAPGALRSLGFRLTVPAEMRAEFARGVPAIFAGWATGGLFLSLGASIVHAELGGAAHVWQGLAVGVLAGSGAVAAFLLRRRSPRAIAVFGTAALAVGTACSLGALAAGSLPAYLAAVAVTGSGFGTAFFGVVSSLAPHIPASQRADVFAVVFLVSYLAFGVPTVVAGLLVEFAGLAPVAFGYGAVVIVFAGAACVVRVLQR
ncbi:MFS transporter [Leucobacter chromiiresistens]|uniref:Major facilitator transporter n=1 Tax=Leucobacter chromiiresistens TaxID=1079994 RepID=A0A147EN61_9MICO|nr:MFS transporter [Leucobacter chromiiresistens]KTR85770.1 major facilitator transporter [Leucobacter chromiiresistens]